MEIDIVYSVKDPVGVSASKLLVEHLRASPSTCPGAKECYRYEGGLIAGYEQELLDLEILDVSPRSEVRPLIALSRHASRECRGTLSVHHVGNPTSLTNGGKPFELGVSYPALAKALIFYYFKLSQELKLDSTYEVTLEATHHGPTGSKKPLVFIEVGSCEEQWRDMKAILALALTVSNVVNKLEEGLPNCMSATAFGGPHYPKRYTKAMLESDICFGHIISRHQLVEVIREDVIEQALERTYPEPSRFIVIGKKDLSKNFRGGLRESDLEKESYCKVLVAGRGFEPRSRGLS
ncbi:MAG: D-aminoacyl-tRNA deacylase, partial [Acidilobaceae archaeon]